jgi:ubiquinone/menaquinone biosynthesis C-methylase UbiE
MNQSSQQYYDEFSESYEDHRHEGYHRLLDELEMEVASRYCTGSVLEAGCGTGLILNRLAKRAQRATGIDLSAGMLKPAQARELSVAQAPVDCLPFADGEFDAVFSFKVLAHIPNIGEALAELARVTKPGGHLVLEFYNRHSLRYLIKMAKRPNRIGGKYTDEDVYTRYDSLEQIRSYLPPSVEFVDSAGVRVVTPAAFVHRLPVVSHAFAAAERYALEAPLIHRLGGFLIAVMKKRG